MNFRETVTPEERGQIMERLMFGDSAPRIAYEMGLTLKAVCDIRNELLEAGELSYEDNKLPAQELQRYCIDNKLFTKGDNEQYKRIFDKLRQGFPLHDIATIVWACSETSKTADEIELDLRRLIP